jgi:hypothetical protein
MEIMEANVNRKRFLRHLGVGLAAGVGVMVAPKVAVAGSGGPVGGARPARPGRPDSVNCCKNSGCGPCQSGTPYHCDCGACCSYCICHTDVGNCYSGPC